MAAPRLTHASNIDEEAKTPISPIEKLRRSLSLHSKLASTVKLALDLNFPNALRNMIVEQAYGIEVFSDIPDLCDQNPTLFKNLLEAAFVSNPLSSKAYPHLLNKFKALPDLTNDKAYYASGQTKITASAPTLACDLIQNPPYKYYTLCMMLRNNEVDTGPISGQMRSSDLEAKVIGPAGSPSRSVLFHAAKAKNTNQIDKPDREIFGLLLAYSKVDRVPHEEVSVILEALTLLIDKTSPSEIERAWQVSLQERLGLKDIPLAAGSAAAVGRLGVLAAPTTSTSPMSTSLALR